MKSSIIIPTLLLLGVVAVLGAPSSNSTTSPGTGGNKRPVAAPKSGSPTTKSPSSSPGSSAVRGNLSGVPSTGKKSNSTSQDPKIRTRREQAEDSHPSGSTLHHSEDKKSEEPEESDSGSHFSLPSNHPLFATRTSSNITDSLRPKLRSTPSQSSGDHVGDESSDESGSSNTSHKIPKRPQRVKATSSEEESISVISSGPIGVSGGVGFSGKANSTTPVKGFASGTNKRGPSPPPKKEAEEEEDLF